MTCATMSAGAMPIDSGDGSDWTLRWDNTVKTSAAYRLRNPDSALTGSYRGGSLRNQDDGDRNFGKGLSSLRADLLTELDLIHRDGAGARLSAAAWYDYAYHRSTDQTSGRTVNAISSPYDQFTGSTRHQQGGDARLLDAFVFKQGMLGDRPWTVRLGRYALVWGESLFFGNNSLAAGMAAQDIAKIVSVPNAQTKETTLPIEQVSGQVLLTPKVAVAAYVQMRWRRSELPAAGSYFSSTDILDRGGERLLLTDAPPGIGWLRAPDEKAKNTGQFGLQTKISSGDGETSYGLYLIRYHDKSFRIYLNPVGSTYQLVFPENITAFGGSMSRNVGAAAISGELSVRRNAPLVSAGQLNVSGRGDNDNNPLYAIGKTAHLNINAMVPIDRNRLFDGGTLLAEMALNRRLSVDRNPAALDGNTERDAVALRAVMAMNFFQVADNLDLTVPVGISYSPKARSSSVPGFAVQRGGDFNVGLQFDYQQVWKTNLSWVYFYGPAGPSQDPNTVGGQANRFTFLQSMKDRNYVAFSVSRTF
jgi:hypothetical protein